jgi:alanine dehydrogenase
MHPSSLAHFDAQAIQQAMPMARAIDAVADAFRATSLKRLTQPPRMRVSLPKGDTLLMPAFLDSDTPSARAYTIKIVSIFPENPTQGLPTCPGLLICLDPDTGVPQALMDAHALTTLRTGAAGGLSAKMLSREDSTVLTCIGCGDQARGQIEGILAVRPIQTIHLVGRNEDRARPLLSWLQVQSVNFDFSTEADEAVTKADIVACATSSSTAVFSASAVRPGTHVISVGSYRADMAEVPAETVQSARVFVDQIEAAQNEAGDLLKANVKPTMELGQLLLEQVPGRENLEQVTFFKSVGLAAQDAAVAQRILTEAATTE